MAVHREDGRVKDVRGFPRRPAFERPEQALPFPGRMAGFRYLLLRSAKPLVHDVVMRVERRSERPLVLVAHGVPEVLGVGSGNVEQSDLAAAATLGNRQSSDESEDDRLIEHPPLLLAEGAQEPSAAPEKRTSLFQRDLGDRIDLEISPLQVPVLPLPRIACEPCQIVVGRRPEHPAGKVVQPKVVDQALQPPSCPCDTVFRPATAAFEPCGHGAHPMQVFGERERRFRSRCCAGTRRP